MKHITDMKDKNFGILLGFWIGATIQSIATEVQILQKTMVLLAIAILFYSLYSLFIIEKDKERILK